MRPVFANEEARSQRLMHRAEGAQDEALHTRTGLSALLAMAALHDIAADTAQLCHEFGCEAGWTRAGNT